MRPTVVSVDCSTGEETVRPMDDDELSQWQTDVAAAAEAAKNPPPPPTTLEDLAAAIANAASFDEAKANLAALTDQKEPAK